VIALPALRGFDLDADVLAGDHSYDARAYCRAEAVEVAGDILEPA
jgi:hypothetical protein